MRRCFYYVVLTALIALSANSLKAQFTIANDSAFTAGKPMSGRLWGLAFGDYYYKNHADALSRGGNNQYTGIPKDRNAFQLRRIYLGYDFNFNKKFAAEFLLAAEDNFPAGNPPTSTTASGDELTNGKLSLYVKLADVRWKNIWKGTDLVLGQQLTPAFVMMTEKIWNYRSVERTMEDIRRTPAFDLGASLQGTFDPKTKNFGYDVMVGNGSSAKPESDNYKWFYGDVWGKFLDQKLIVDFYGDYNRYIWNPTLHLSRNMWKGMIAYSTDPITVGVEGFLNNFKNGLQATRIDDGSTVLLNDQAKGYSVYVHGNIIKSKLCFFARFDHYIPINKVDNSVYSNYVMNSSLTAYNDNSYSSVSPVTAIGDETYKQNFITAGLDYMPIKNVHVIPNVWYNHYATQLSDNVMENSNYYPNLTSDLISRAKGDYDLVWRLTFVFNFGR